MRVAITQPNFLPWLGYFDLLDQVDVWISLDNVQRSKQSFSARNRVKLKSGASKWLSVPLQKCALETTLAQQPLAAGDWPTRFLQTIRDNYREAPYLEHASTLLETLFVPREEEGSLSRYNERIIQTISRQLGVSYEFHRASELVEELTGTPQEKVFRLLETVPATAFLNFQRGVEMGLYNASEFSARKITLLKHDYQHPEYGQLGRDFVPYLSVLDLLLNEGPQALAIIRSGSKWVAP